MESASLAMPAGADATQPGCAAAHKDAVDAVVVSLVEQITIDDGLGEAEALERAAVYLESTYSAYADQDGPYRGLIARAALWSPEAEVRERCAAWCVCRQYFGTSRLTAETLAMAIYDSHPEPLRARMRAEHRAWLAGIIPQVARALDAPEGTARVLLRRLDRQPEVTRQPSLLSPAARLGAYLVGESHATAMRMMTICDEMPGCVSERERKTAGELLDDLIAACPLPDGRGVAGIYNPVPGSPVRIGPWTEWSVSRAGVNTAGARQQDSSYVTQEEHRATLNLTGEGVLTLTAANHGRQALWRVEVSGKGTLAAPRERGKKRRRRKPDGG